MYLCNKVKYMQTELEKLITRYRTLEIDKQIDYDKFYLYSLITHSTAIEGSTITELENQIMFDQGISLKGKSIEEQNMNLDLKNAYEYAIKLAHAHSNITIDLLIKLSALVMKNTGQEYKTALGDFAFTKCYSRHWGKIVYGLSQGANKTIRILHLAEQGTRKLHK